MKHLLPTEAWNWLQAETERRAAQGLEPPLFVDVRMEIESLYVGRRSEEHTSELQSQR